MNCIWHASLTQLLKHPLPVQSLLNDPLVWPMVRKGYEEPGYFQSTEWERLKSQVNVGADQLLPVELGLDWGQPFEYRTHSVGIITLRWAKFVELWVEGLSLLIFLGSRSWNLLRCRIHSLPLQHRAKRRFGRVLMVIAGPEEPKFMDAYMHQIVIKLLKYGPGKAGKLAAGNALWWPTACTASSGLIGGRCVWYSPLLAGAPEAQGGLSMKLRQRQHGESQLVQHKVYPVLTGIHGDAPAIKKLNKSLMWMNTLCCHYCLLHGTRINNTIRLLGYLSPVSQGEHAVSPSCRVILEGLHSVEHIWQAAVELAGLPCTRARPRWDLCVQVPSCA